MADEVIAFDTSKQSSYAKAVKHIKKSIASEAARKESGPKYRRGVILISHLPHGFYENELKGFFSQFGKVTRLRVARSKKTGRPKGYAFVEFEFEEVAQIAAESMHNYLMFERLVKCEVLTGNVNAKKLFGGPEYGANNYPTLARRAEMKKKQSEPMTEEEEEKTLQVRLSSIEKRNKKLAELGIDYEFKLKPKAPTLAAPAPRKAEPEETKTADKKKSPAKLKVSPKVLRSRAKTGEIQSAVPRSTPDKKALKNTRMSLNVPSEVVKKSHERSTATTPKIIKNQQRMSCNVPLMATKSPAPAKKMPAAALGTPAKTPMKGGKSRTPASAVGSAKATNNKRMSCTVPAAVSKPEKTLPKFSPKLLRSRAKETGVAPVAVPLPKRRKSTV